MLYKEMMVVEVQLEEGTINQREELFTDNPERIKLFEAWLKRREVWRSAQLPKKQGLDLYNNLFRLYSDIKKEAESVELILGDGHIKWQAPERKIDHPVYLRKVSLELNSDKPAFLVKCNEAKPEIYTSMLRVVSSINQAMLSEVLLEAEEKQYHIGDIENTKGFYQRLITVVASQGKLVDVSESISRDPIITIDPILFLRKRTLGFSNLITQIIKDIDETEGRYTPRFFGPMFGDYSNQSEDVIIEENWNQSGMDQDILLTLPANNEQLKIIKFLNKYGAVLVQGPPGTGKTHTIANLIGHLLSEGMSVLITSHTEKALTVLKDKVYQDLQSLCLSLLSASSQRKEMDSALFEIAQKNTSLDLNESKQKIKKLELERKELISHFKVKQEEFLQIRSLEYKDLVYSNQTITPIEAAKLIKKGEGTLDFIPGPTLDDTIGLPLLQAELVELYHSNALLNADEEDLLSKGLPERGLLWPLDNFKERLQDWEQLTVVLADWKENYFDLERIDLADINSIIEAAYELKVEIEEIHPLKKAIITTCLKDMIYYQFWIDVFAECDSLMHEYEQYCRLMFENEIVIPDELATEEIISVLLEIIDSGKEKPVTFLNGLTKPKWKKLRDDITINNKCLDVRADYQTVKTVLAYQIKRISVVNKINKLLNQMQASNILLDDFEHKINELKNIILPANKWHDNNWLALISKIKKIAKNSEKLNQVMSLDNERPFDSMNNILATHIIPELIGTANKLRLKHNMSQWNMYYNVLIEAAPNDALYEQLRKGVIEKDLECYSHAYNQLQKLYEKVAIYERRTALLNFINNYAPGWAESLMHRKGVHGSEVVSNNIELAWRWLQIDSQIKRIDSYDPNTIQRELQKINERLIWNARKLAYEKAWYNIVVNNNTEQNQAIEGWRQTMRLVGKATGKNAPMLLKKARELMPKCQSAIPVWIMPLNRVAESFDPKNKFDVIIIDEASQADILAMSDLYLGKKVIIVGDDEQVSPDTVGMKTEEVNALIEQHLTGIPNKHLYNGRTSIYDIAKASGFKPLMLTEHFRCLPDIISFSNQLSYNGKIRPLRDTSNIFIKPAVIEYRVLNAIQHNKVNITESEHIASLIIACSENNAYKGKTMGVISLLGQDQSYEIDRLLQTYLDPKEYEQRRIQCGTPAQFQGDERDIIFLSLVQGPKEQGGPLRLLSEDGNNDLTRKRYNVAASRAKDQIWVVHSLNPEIDLKHDDIRLRLIKHAINPSNTVAEASLTTTESDFESQVMKTLINQGYQVVSQWQVGAYRIDLVVQDGDKRIAIECDGEKWHTVDDLPNDLKRQAILERLGWRFIRIRGSAFYKNPEGTMQLVFDELARHDIKPNYKLDVEEDIMQQDKSETFLVDEIKQRAILIRKAWNEELTGEDTQNESKEDLSKTTDALENENTISIEVVSVENNKKNLITQEKESINKIVKPHGKQEVKQEKTEVQHENAESIKNKNKTTGNPMFDFRKSKESEIIEKKHNKDIKGNHTKNVANRKDKQEVPDKQSIQKPKFDFRKH
ncbi:MAG: AAA family ATPase [Clostridia bacterium]|nr:AAA family ATPase [Clostridia bacterium]